MHQEQRWPQTPHIPMGKIFNAASKGQMGTRSSEATAVVFALCCCQAASLMLSTLMLELLTDKRAGTGARQRFNQQQKEIVLARSSKECRFAHFLLFCLLYDSKCKKNKQIEFVPLFLLWPRVYSWVLKFRFYWLF